MPTNYKHFSISRFAAAGFASVGPKARHGPINYGSTPGIEQAAQGLRTVPGEKGGARCMFFAGQISWCVWRH